MKWLETFVSPTREELANWNAEQAERMDRINAEIYKRNRMIVTKAKRILSAGAHGIASIQDLEPPAIQIEYSRKFHELAEREREAEAAALAREAAAEEAAALAAATAAARGEHG